MYKIRRFSLLPLLQTYCYVGTTLPLKSKTESCDLATHTSVAKMQMFRAKLIVQRVINL